MNRPVLLALLVLSLIAPVVMAAQQTVRSTQVRVEPKSQTPSWTEAKRRWLARAEHGDVDAQFWLGAGYEQGWFGKPDIQRAVKWLHMAAKQGNPDAENALGHMYEYGSGVGQDYSQAAKWYRKAAEHVPDLGGAGQGRNNLGLLYLDGFGVPKDYVQAYMWFRLANSESNVSEARARMSSAEIAQAERMATEWKSSHPES